MNLANQIARQLVMHRTQLLQSLNAPGWIDPHTSAERNAAEKASQDCFAQLIEPFLTSSGLNG